MQLAQARNEFYASNQDNEAQALSNLIGAWRNKKLRTAKYFLGHQQGLLCHAKAKPMMNQWLMA